MRSVIAIAIQYEVNNMVRNMYYADVRTSRIKIITGKIVLIVGTGVLK